MAVFLTVIYGHGATKVEVGPSTQQPACATPASRTSTVTVYDQPSLKVGWLPAGYHRVSGTDSPPNNSRPLTYGPNGANQAESIQVVLDVGLSAQQLPPPAGTGLGMQISTVDIRGSNAGVYKVASQTTATFLEWSPTFEVAVEVRGTDVALSVLEEVAGSIITSLGPPTVVASTSYLGPVIPYRTVTSSPAVVRAFPMLFAGGDLAGKLATYAEVRAAIGSEETGGTDAADGTPVWLIYNQEPARTNPATASYAIVDATTGIPIEGGSEQLVDGTADPASLDWIGQVPDHQHIQPCTAPDHTNVTPPNK